MSMSKTTDQEKPDQNPQKTQPLSQPTLPQDQFRPVDWEAHQRDKERRRKEREAKAPLLRRCLDPEYAAQQETLKPKWEWEVSVKYMIPDAKGRLVTKSDTQRIVAQNEADAWATWCDRVQHWPSPHACEKREIRQLAKVS
jgi:hypothetical protein